MSATLREINASGSRKTAIIRTFEITSDTWPTAVEIGWEARL